jgi:signal transduction histidine kinase
VILHCEMLRRSHPGSMQDIEPIVRQLKDLLEDIRYLVQGLHPPLLERQGLVEAIHHHVELCRVRTGLDITFHSPPLPSLSSDHALCLFRIVQEGLQNSIKHAAATEIGIEIRQTPTAMVLTVRDNGRGFNVGEMLASASGLGLLGMRERVEQLHGTLTFTSAPHQGTTVTARLPLSSAPPQP